MGLLGKAGKSGLFGVAGFLLSKKKKKAPGPTNASATAVNHAAPTSAVNKSTGSGVVQVNPGDRSQMTPTTEAVAPRSFSAGFRARATEVNKEYEQRRRKRRTNGLGSYGED